MAVEQTAFIENEITAHEGNDFTKQPVLGKRTIDDLKGCTVVIFNHSGKKIYSGEWSLEKNRELMQPGMYIFNIIKAGVRIDSGKFYKRDI
jgi:hypothetical protein